MVSTYFDTPALYFRKNGASLRVRAIGERRLQTLMLDGAAAAGLYGRDQFDGPVHGDTPDLASLRQLIPKDSDGATELLADDGLAERLQPLFVTRVNRSAAVIRLPDGTAIELALDDGVVEAGADPSAAIHGVKLN
nr:CYTH domain-containing protein [Burkholderia sp. WP9]